jgi:hypothetical protein
MVRDSGALVWQFLSHAERIATLKTEGSQTRVPKAWLPTRLPESLVRLVAPFEGHGYTNICQRYLMGNEVSAAH